MSKNKNPKVVKQPELHTVKNQVKQGETNFDKIKDSIIDSETVGKGRPSCKDGRWKLNNGDWARREGAQFTKIGKAWVEVTQREMASV